MGTRACNCVILWWPAAPECGCRLRRHVAAGCAGVWCPAAPASGSRLRRRVEPAAPACGLRLRRASCEPRGRGARLAAFQAFQAFQAFRLPAVLHSCANSDGHSSLQLHHLVVVRLRRRVAAGCAGVWPPAAPACSRRLRRRVAAPHHPPRTPPLWRVAAGCAVSTAEHMHAQVSKETDLYGKRGRFALAYQRYPRWLRMSVLCLLCIAKGYTVTEKKGCNANTADLGDESAAVRESSIANAGLGAFSLRLVKQGATVGRYHCTIHRSGTAATADRPYSRGVNSTHAYDGEGITQRNPMRHVNSIALHDTWCLGSNNRRHTQAQ